MYVVIDTPVMKDLVRNLERLKHLLEKLNTSFVNVIITYTLRKQYENVIGIEVNDLRIRFRAIGYRVRFTEISRQEEKRIVSKYSNLINLLKRTLSTKKHSGSDDALIIACSAIHAYKSNTRKFIVIAKGMHVVFYTSAKTIVEKVLKTRECWFSVFDYDLVE